MRDLTLVKAIQTCGLSSLKVWKPTSQSFAHTDKVSDKSINTYLTCKEKKGSLVTYHRKMNRLLPSISEEDWI